jgi:hypothetical protein
MPMKGHQQPVAKSMTNKITGHDRRTSTVSDL